MYRSYIEIKTSSVSGAPAEYGCDANNNNVYDKAVDGEWIPCHFLSWPDVAFFMDWSGLAPMSELQFERICRGHSSSVSPPANFGEFAWGSTNIYDSSYTLSSASTASEVITNDTCTEGNAVIMVRNGSWIDSSPPLAVGYRNGVQPAVSSRLEGYGWRGVLYIR